MGYYIKLSSLRDTERHLLSRKRHQSISEYEGTYFKTIEISGSTLAVYVISL